MALQDHQQKHISDWEASGLSQAVYCRAHGLNAKTFGNWLRAKRRGNKHAIKSPALIPVTIKPVAASTEVRRVGNVFLPTMHALAVTRGRPNSGCPF